MSCSWFISLRWPTLSNTLWRTVPKLQASNTLGYVWCCFRYHGMFFIYLFIVSTDLLLRVIAVHIQFSTRGYSWVTHARHPSSTRQGNLQRPSSHLGWAIHCLDVFCRRRKANYGWYWSKVCNVWLMDHILMHIIELQRYLAFQVFAGSLKAENSSNGLEMIPRPLWRYALYSLVTRSWPFFRCLFPQSLGTFLMIWWDVLSHSLTSVISHDSHLIQWELLNKWIMPYKGFFNTGPSSRSMVYDLMDSPFPGNIPFSTISLPSSSSVHPMDSAHQLLNQSTFRLSKSPGEHPVRITPFLKYSSGMSD